MYVYGWVTYSFNRHAGGKDLYIFKLPQYGWVLIKKYLYMGGFQMKSLTMHGWVYTSPGSSYASAYISSTPPGYNPKNRGGNFQAHKKYPSQFIYFCRTMHMNGILGLGLISKLLKKKFCQMLKHAQNEFYLYFLRKQCTQKVYLS